MLFAYQNDEVRRIWLKRCRLKGDAADSFVERANVVRARGHHEAASHFVRGIVDLSAPILRGDTAVAALTIPFVHSNPLQVEMPQAVEFVRAAAKQISERNRARGPSMTEATRAATSPAPSSRRDICSPRFSSSALFFIWGVSNSLNDVLIPQFRKTFQLDDFASSLVQFGVLLRLLLFAIPASLFMRRFGYRAAVVMGLGAVRRGRAAVLPGRAVRPVLRFLDRAVRDRQRTRRFSRLPRIR